MREIAFFDEKDYMETWATFKREAVRGIILKNGKLALVKSEKAKYYKFPGGGLRKNESHEEALIREIREETGLIAKKDSITPYGYVKERRKSRMYVREIFEQVSFYYCVDIEDGMTETELEYYERELEYRLDWTDARNACEYNALNENSDNPDAGIYRDTYVMRLLAGGGEKGVM